MSHEAVDGRLSDTVALSGQIVAVARNRDRPAFAALYGHFAPRLKTYFMRYVTVDEAMADELVQETMLLVWRKAGLFDPGRAAASTWVFSVARNVRVDAWRYEQRRTGSAAGEVAPSPPAADDLVASAAREKALHEALRSLPKDQVHLVLLSFFKDQSHTEIASSVGLPLGTVKSRLRTALARLRAVMSDKP